MKFFIGIQGRVLHLPVCRFTMVNLCGMFALFEVKSNPACGYARITCQWLRTVWKCQDTVILHDAQNLKFVLLITTKRVHKFKTVILNFQKVHFACTKMECRCSQFNSFSSATYCLSHQQGAVFYGFCEGALQRHAVQHVLKV